MNNGIAFTVIWADRDVCKLRVRCSNGHFSGVATIYIGHDDLSTIAHALNGFPSQSTDSRNFELGAFDPKCAGGGVRMHFFCRDSAGHVAVDTMLRDHSCIALGEIESVALRIPIEAAAIDSFLSQLRELDTNELGATACLEMAR